MQKHLLTALVASALASSLQAQENTDTANLEEIIVTANKMEENLKDIPASISVISDLDIEDKRLTSIDDVIKQIPNMSGANIGYAIGTNFRGINSSVFSNSNPMVIYVDGVPQYGSNDYDVMLKNAQRIEVLRGPQGTLYGKDAIGGVINVISKTPENQWQGSAGFEVGSNQYLQGSFNANGALVKDKLFLNVGLQADKHNGWITNDFDGSDADVDKNIKFNTTLTFKPTDRLTTKLSLATYKINNDWASAGIGDFNTITRKDAEHANFDVPYETEKNSFSQALNIDYDFDAVKFSSLTTHKRFTSVGIYDFDQRYDPNNTSHSNGLYQFQDTENKDLTQEFKLTSNTDGRFKWLAGLYFDKSKVSNIKMGYQFPYIDRATEQYFGTFEQDIPSVSDSKTVAAFAQGSYDVTDALTITLGGRYQKVQRNVNLENYLYPLAIGKITPVFSRSEKTSWNAFLPKLALSYAVNDNLTSYFSYSQGYMPGGFNFFPLSPADKLKFEPQTSDNFEIGMRGDFLGGDLAINAAVFYMDIDNIHLYNNGFDENGRYFNEVSNAGKAKSKGLELDARYQINDQWAISAALGVTDAKYTRHSNPNYNGNTVSMSPKYTANLGLSYFHPEGFYARLDINSEGTKYIDDANSKKQKAWVTADVKVGYLLNDFNIYGYINNLTDEEYIHNTRPSGSVDQNFFNPPRTFGVGLRYSF